MNITTILVVVLVLILIGVLPIWPHSLRWSWTPGLSLTILLLVMLALVFFGRI